MAMVVLLCMALQNNARVWKVLMEKYCMNSGNDFFRSAYIQHIYHTNAMEGNTMTLMQTRAIVETGIAVGGKSVYEHNEGKGLWNR